jgi:hypothetical protein
VARQRRWRPGPPGSQRRGCQPGGVAREPNRGRASLVTDVYVDVATASVEGSRAPSAASGEASAQVADAEAVRALRYLAESGIRVILVAGEGARAPRELADVAAEVVPALPPGPRPQAWYLTSDMSRCGEASARLRTVLIGGSQPPGAIRRCDATARDVQAAAMEILAAVAMPPRGDRRAG